MRVVNASPLIVLSKLGRLDLLLEPRPDIEVVVPQAVLDEVMRGEPDDPAVSLVPKAVADWMRVIPTPRFMHFSESVFSTPERSPSSPWSSIILVGRRCSTTIPHAVRRPGWGSRASAPSVWS